MSPMCTENETDLDEFSNGVNIQTTFRRFLCFSYFTCVVRDKIEVPVPLNLHNRIGQDARFLRNWPVTC